MNKGRKRPAVSQLFQRHTWINRTAGSLTNWQPIPRNTKRNVCLNTAFQQDCNQRKKTCMIRKTPGGSGTVIIFYVIGKVWKHLNMPFCWHPFKRRKNPNGCSSNSKQGSKSFTKPKHYGSTGKSSRFLHISCTMNEEIMEACTDIWY